jgi:hypothetical protein
MSGPLRQIRGHPWYPLLKPSFDGGGKDGGGGPGPALLDDYRLSDLTSRRALIMCLTTLEGWRVYSVFATYQEFGLYYLKFPLVERCFYEVIIGDAPQKPKFDIDLDLNEVRGVEPQKVVLSTIKSILEELELVQVPINPLTDLLVFSSCDVSKGKYSYHIVIDNYCHATNLEAKAFYKKVVAHLPPSWISANLVDSSVYSIKQQFRIVGSSKLQVNRYKSLVEGWTNPVSGEDVTYATPTVSDKELLMIMLKSSLVSQTAHCQPLPTFIDLTAGPKKSVDDELEEVTPEEAKRALEIIANSAGLTINDRKFPYRLGEIKGPLVTLKRIKPSKCLICCRVHEHENPYLLIVGLNKTILFYCRRAPPEKHVVMGELKSREDSAIEWALQAMKGIELKTSSDDECKPIDSPASVLEELAHSSTEVKKAVEPTTMIVKKEMDLNMKKVMRKASKKTSWTSLKM